MRYLVGSALPAALVWWCPLGAAHGRGHSRFFLTLMNGVKPFRASLGYFSWEVLSSKHSVGHLLNVRYSTSTMPNLLTERMIRPMEL